jgi:hypothetical protein
MLTFLLLAFSLSGYAASCDADEFVKSMEGKEKIAGLVERSKTLAISKLEDLGFEERQIQLKVDLPKAFPDTGSSLKIEVIKKDLEVKGSRFELTKTSQDGDCGLEVTIFGGRLINQQGGKDFGSLGSVKEFIRLN